MLNSNKMISLQTVKKFYQIVFLFSILLFLVGCSSTEKVMRSKDPNFKYTKALEWYNKGAYFKAIPVFEELMGLYKGSKTTEEIYYYYCMAQFKQGNYIMSAYHFKNFVQKHPYSNYTEECLYMHAESYAKQSPKFNLDQTETYKAIDAYQIFINQYPESERVAYCNEQIDAMRLKLESKALKAADLYYKTQNYRAAAFSYKNLLIDYPDIDNPEGIQFKVVKSFYKYAEQSIAFKQQERYEEAIKYATTFLNRYTESDFKKNIQETRELAHLKAITSAFDAATYTNLENRDEELNAVYEVFQVHIAAIEDEKLKTQAQTIKEKVGFELIKTHFLQAQNATELADRKDHYIEAINAYSSFINEYKNSKFSKEAVKLFNASQKNLKKYTNG